MYGVINEIDVIVVVFSLKQGFRCANYVVLDTRSCLYNDAL